MNNLNGENLLNSELDRYLGQTRLSLSQIATKLEISKGHLSEIKNRKKRPGLDLGLRILRVCDTPVETRKLWVEQEFLGCSEEYELLGQTTKEGEVKEKLNFAVSKRLEKNLPLLNMLLDISNRGPKGITKSELKEDYGLHGIRELDFFLDQGIVTTNDGNFFGGNKRFVITKSSSYKLMQTIFDELQSRYDKGILEKTKFQFEIDDVAEDALPELNALFEDYMKKSSQIIKKYKMNNAPGSCRVIVQNLYSMIKRNSLMLIILFLSVNYSPLSMAIGGLEGGGSAEKGHAMETFETREEAIEKARRLRQRYMKKGTSEYLQAVSAGCKEEDGHDVTYRYYDDPKVEVKKEKVREFYLSQDEKVYAPYILYSVKCNRYTKRR